MKKIACKEVQIWPIGMILDMWGTLKVLERSLTKQAPYYPFFGAGERTSCS
uniref:Uncharacterized protein n=1 Tax=Rhizophora mucronata TaxID=61149 RepID=A0A2P2Q4Q4_RHIMU